MPDETAVSMHETYSPVAQGGDLASDVFPEMWTMSGAWFYQRLPMPVNPDPIELAHVRIDRPAGRGRTRGSSSLAAYGFISSWNLAWEAAELRPQAMREGSFPLGRDDEIPPQFQWLAQRDTANLTLLPQEGPHRIGSYAPLYHLLPARLLERYHLPALKRGVWPPRTYGSTEDALLPTDVERRLKRAIAHLMWPYLTRQSPIRAYKADAPLRLLAGDLDFWLGYAVEVLETRWRQLPEVAPETSAEARSLRRRQASVPTGYRVAKPRFGGTVWMGEAEAAEVTAEIVAAADRNGRLSGILDAIRSHRVEEDFTAIWSRAREDLERRLYRTRSKIRPVFVEIDDTIPTHGPESEVLDDLAWQHFFTLLDEKDRKVFVCLRSGATKVGDIARQLGYANHSPVSKRIARIGRRARHFFDERS